MSWETKGRPSIKILKQNNIQVDSGEWVISTGGGRKNKFPLI